MLQPQEKFMKAAVDEAIRARENGDYAIGAVIVCDEQVIVRSTNRSKIDQDATQHAEIVAIREASRLLGSRYLENCILYTTHEPCPMCASAVVWAKMKGLVFGARMEDMAEYRVNNGNKDWKWRTINISSREVLTKGDPQVDLVEDFMRNECRMLFHS